MKHNRLFRVLAAAVILALLMLAIPTTALGATGTVSITSPTSASGSPGTPVTLSCTGFTTMDSTYTIYFGGATLTSGSTDSAAAFDASFTVPERSEGSYTVTVSTTSDTAYTTFTVIPEISLDDYSGNVGDEVTVDGVGFAANSELTVSFGGDEVTITGGDDETDAYGSFDDLTFTVPDSTKGSHTVEVEDESSNDDGASYTVSPKIALNPTSGGVGDTITVSGTGFADDSELTIEFAGDEVTITSGDDETDDDGSFSCTFVVPDATRGGHTVKAEDEDSNDDTATFTVSASITINPTSGSAGTTVTVTGNGFGASKTITITYNNNTVSTSPTSVTTNSAGYFTATFTVPAALSGVYVVKASDNTNTATANFTSTTDASIAPTTSSTSPGYVGLELTITGLGFSPSGTINVEYDDVNVGSKDIDSSGNFEIKFNVPASTAGEHIIEVSDGLNTKTFTFYMESTAPSVPEIIQPLADTKLKDNLFEWEAVTDESGPVTYNLQVSSDNTFTGDALLITKTGLTETSYTLLDEEKLESTSDEAPYYWRVGAVDAASNTGAWSEATPFTTGWSFEFTGWVVWVTMVLVAVAFFFIGLWVGRRGGGGGYY